MSVYCSRCGSENPEDAAFCYHCGARFASHVTPLGNEQAQSGSVPPENLVGFGKQNAPEAPASEGSPEAPAQAVQHPPHTQDDAERQRLQQTGHWLETHDPTRNASGGYSAGAYRSASRTSRLINLPFEPASFSQRFFAFFIDLIIIRLVLLIATRIADLDMSDAFSSEKQLNQFVSDYWSFLMTGEIGGLLSQYFQTIMYTFYLMLALSFFYYLIFHAIGGQTPGKFALGIRVTRIDGRPIGFGLSLFRYIVYFFGSKVLYLDSITAMFNPQVATWHDFAAGTRVYRVASLEAPAPISENERET